MPHGLQDVVGVFPVEKIAVLSNLYEVRQPITPLCANLPSLVVALFDQSDSSLPSEPVNDFETPAIAIY